MNLCDGRGLTVMSSQNTPWCLSHSPRVISSISSRDIIATILIIYVSLNDTRWHESDRNRMGLAGVDLDALRHRHVFLFEEHECEGKEEEDE